MSSRNNNNSLMKRELQLMLAQGSGRIALAENTMRRRSCIWNYYKRVLLDGEDQPFASCNYCGTLVHYSSKHGTGSLLRHKCNTYSVSLYAGGDQALHTASTDPAGVPSGAGASSSRAGKHANVTSSSSLTVAGAELNGAAQPRHGRASSKMTVPTRRGTRVPKVAPMVTTSIGAVPSLATANAPSSRSQRMPAATSHCVTDEQLLMSTLAEKQVAFIAKDLRPVDTTDGAGFLELAQALMEVAAAESGGGAVVPVCDVLVAQPLLAAVYMPRMVDRIRLGLAADLAGVERLALALDIWNNDAGRRFVTLSATYVTDEFELKNAVLGTRDLSVQAVAAPSSGSVESGERKFRVKSEEGAAVVRAMLDIVSEYTGSVESAAEKLSSGALITDDPNLYAALADATSTRLLCPCRMLNNILDEVLSPTGRSTSPAWRQLCHDCDTLIEFLRCSGISDQHALKRPLTERQTLAAWSDVYDVLLSIRDHHPQLQSLLAEVGQAGRLMRRLTEPVLDEVVAFLDLFKECLESLCVDSYPTINECVLWRLKLEKHCATAIAENLATGGATSAATGADDEFPNWLRDIQRSLRDKLKHSLGLDKLCSVALLLDPNFKSLRMLAEGDRKWTKEVTMSYMREVRAATAPSGRSSSDEADDPDVVGGRRRPQRFSDRGATNVATTGRDLKPPPAHQAQPSTEMRSQRAHCPAVRQPASPLVVQVAAESCEPPSKRARSLLNFTEFLQGADEEQPPEDPVEVELRRYVELRVAGDQLGDVLLFWKTAGTQFPLLRHLAKWVLAIPACSSVKHCPFSSPGRILDQRRRALNSCVDHIVFLHKNLVT